MGLGWREGRRPVEPTLHFPPPPSSPAGTPPPGCRNPLQEAGKCIASCRPEGVAGERAALSVSLISGLTNLQIHTYPKLYTFLKPYLVSPGFFLPSSLPSYSLCLPSPLSLPFPTCSFQRISEVHMGVQVSWFLSLPASARSMGLSWL